MTGDWMRRWLDEESRRMYSSAADYADLNAQTYAGTDDYLHAAQDCDLAERDRLRRMFWRDQKGIR